MALSGPATCVEAVDDCLMAETETDWQHPGRTVGPPRLWPRASGRSVCGAAWQQAAGAAWPPSRAGQVRRGVLEVWVTTPRWCRNCRSRNRDCWQDLAQLMPDEKIRDLKFRVGPID